MEGKSKCKPATKKELAWIERVRKVMSAHPKGLWLFSNGQAMYVMKDPADGNRMNGDAVNSDNIIGSIPSHIIYSEGGDW